METHRIIVKTIKDIRQRPATITAGELLILGSLWWVLGDVAPAIHGADAHDIYTWAGTWFLLWGLGKLLVS